MTVIQLRVDELTTEQLDAFVLWVDNPGARHSTLWSPSTHWRIGGPIIELELIDTRWDAGTQMWHAVMEHPARADGVQRSFQSGPRLLVAAMRCYVVSKFGETVELPV